MPGLYRCICLITRACKNRLHRLPPKKDYHVYITRSIYHYAYARQTQVNWKTETKSKKAEKGKEGEDSDKKAYYYYYFITMSISRAPGHQASQQLIIHRSDYYSFPSGMCPTFVTAPWHRKLSFTVKCHLRALASSSALTRPPAEPP